MRLIGGNLEQPEVETEPGGEGLRIGRVEADEIGVLAFRQLDVRPGGERPVGICTVKLAVRVTMATSCGLSALKALRFGKEMVKGQKNV